MKTAVNPPRTPVTKGSNGVALATMPNICKMPGPPAPFVPTPLPNVGKSSDNLKGGTKKVKIEGKPVAIKGCSFKSMGDMPSKGTGGGLTSTSTHGSTKFVAPGSMDVKAEGKNIHLLGDATTNNNSNPANAATIKELQGAQGPAIVDALKKIAEECNDKVNQDANAAAGRPAGHKPSGAECTALGTKKHKCCEDSIKQANNPQVKSEVPYGKRGGLLSDKQQAAAFSRANQAYNSEKAVQVANGVTGSALTAALKGGTGVMPKNVAFRCTSARRSSRLMPEKNGSDGSSYASFAATARFTIELGTGRHGPATIDAARPSSFTRR